MAQASREKPADDDRFVNRMDRTWRDAMNGKGKPFFMSGRNFFGSKTFDAKSAYVKDYYVFQKFNAKDFLTGSYNGTHSFWMGDFKFNTASAEAKGSKGRVIPNLTKAYATKSLPVQASRDANKGYGVTGYATKKSGFRGKAQDTIDAQGPAALASSEKVGWQGKMQPMTIEEVRDLLNKPK